MPFLRLLLLTVIAALAAPLAQAAGFSTIEVPANAQGPTLQGAVWTPCGMPNGEIQLGRTVIPGVRGCPIAGAQLPLVVLSHGYGGSFLGHHDTAEALAKAGFVVAAINHSSDNYQLLGGSNDPLLALATRTTDIQRLINYLLQQWPAHTKIAADQIGFFGFSRGGYTGLVLAGARPDFGRLPPLPSSHCTAAPESAACGPMRQTLQELRAAPLAHDLRIRAAVIADPLSMVFDAEGLKNVRIPIQLWASAYGGDGVTPDGVAAVRRNLPVAPDWRVAENGAHFGFLAPCSPAQRQSMPEICRDGPDFDRVAFHAGFNAEVLTFFKRHLAPKP